MLPRCEAGKETSRCEIRGRRRAGDLGWRRDMSKVRCDVRTHSALGMASGRRGRRGWKTDVGGARASDAGLTFADVVANKF